jgi:hypothetical protein
MPQRTHHGWPIHYPIVHPLGMVRQPISQWHTKLLSLWDSIKSRMRKYTTQTCSPGPDDQSLVDTGGGYHLGAQNFKSDHSPSFPSSILHFSLIALLVSNYANHSILSLIHIGHPSIERPLSQVDSNHSASTDSLYN